MKILIKDLTFFTIIGILDDERTTEQRVIVNCIIDYPYSEKQFINYAHVSDLIEKQMNTQKFELIEEALESLSRSLKHSFPSIETLDLTIYKPNILPNCTVGVQKHFNF
jgi:dihydroneopterin aldolase